MLYSIEQIRNYITSQDSLGDALYNLNDEKIQKANPYSDRYEALKKLFLETNEDCTGYIQLDNLDNAKLVRDTYYTTIYRCNVFVENEHGTIFDVEDLSDEEVDAFDWILKNNY